MSTTEWSGPSGDRRRRTTSIRRLLNITGEFGGSGPGLLTGTAGHWAERLAGLALEHGVSGFILMTDDPATIQRFGQEVAPAVRELVAPPAPGQSPA